MGVMSNTDAGKDWMKEDIIYKMLNPQKCIVCTFADDQGKIIDTVYGYAHEYCMEDQYAQEESTSNDYGYDDIAQEKANHLHG